MFEEVEVLGNGEKEKKKKIVNGREMDNIMNMIIKAQLQGSLLPSKNLGPPQSTIGPTANM